MDTTTKVSRADALQVLRAVLEMARYGVCRCELEGACMGQCAFTRAAAPGGWKTPAMMDATPTLSNHLKEGQRPGCWSIAWEGSVAPEYWTLSDRLAERVAELTGGRVFVEAANGCILHVSPA